MTNLTRYRTTDLPDLMERITRNCIGLDDYFDRFFNLPQVSNNYPPYNLVHVSDQVSRLEIALAGFKQEELNVYTEYGKLFVEGQKESADESNYIHKGLAQRSFTRSWTLSDETEVKNVSFNDGLLVIELSKIVPEHHTRKDYLLPEGK